MKVLALIVLLLVQDGADTVWLKGGSKMSGGLTLDGAKATLTMDGGGGAELAVDQIERIAWGPKSPEPAKLRKLYAVKDPAIDRARWCTKFGLEKEAKAAWADVLAEDPENKEALKATGRKPAPPAKEAPKKTPPKKAGPVVKSGPEAWSDIANGLTLRTEHFELRGDVGKEKLVQLAELAERINVFYIEHFGSDIGKEWKMTFFQKQTDFVAYSKKIGSTQYGGGGYCEGDRKEFVGHGDAGHSYETLLKHEMSHSYYVCPGPFWLREGAATLLESLDFEGDKPAVKPNSIRLEQLKAYWKEGKHTGLQCCTLKPVFPIAYAHHWSFHYYVWVKKGAEFYRKMIKELQTTKEKDDLSERVAKMLGMTFDELEKDWQAFCKGLK